MSTHQPHSQLTIMTIALLHALQKASESAVLVKVGQHPERRPEHQEQVGVSAFLFSCSPASVSDCPCGPVVKQVMQSVCL
jgi:hypothetical protein